MADEIFDDGYRGITAISPAQCSVELQVGLVSEILLTLCCEI